MSSRSLSHIVWVLAGLCGTTGCPMPSATQVRVLRVCSDPNNLPFSNRQEEGFENRIADLLTRELGARLEYTWSAQRRGFLRNTLNARLCDVVMGLPYRIEPAETTKPYYRSSYVFVTREGMQPAVASMDDPALKQLKIGVHVVGDDYSNPPPLHALGRRKIVKNVTGYSIYGDYGQPNPPARLVEATAQSVVDVAIVWGPVGGYFGARQPVKMRVVPVSPERDRDLPFVFDIALGVRKGEHKLRDELQAILERRRIDIGTILHDYNLPVIPMSSGK